jgi:hypothetical protein
VGLVAAPPARAQFDPTGDATASDHDATCRWTSTLNPAPAVLTDSTAVLADALDFQKFNPANGWTINYRQLAGTFKLQTYYAWVNRDPRITCGDVSGGGGHSGKIGGAAFALTSRPAGNDPTGAAVHWVQSVRTNDPSFGGHQVAGGFYQLVDNDGSRTDPTYDGNGGAADRACFIDVPYAECDADCNNGASYRFVAYIATVDLTAKRLDVYKNGVSWGYDFSCRPLPEPSTLLSLATGAAMAIRRKRKTR